MTLWYSITTGAGAMVAAWAFWRLNETSASGQWGIKLSVLAVFATSVTWILDRLAGDRWEWDGSAFVCAVAVYLWAGVAQHVRHDRRARRRAAPQTLSGGPT